MALIPFAKLAQGLGSNREPQAGEGIAKRALVGGILEARIPKGTAQLQAVLDLGKGQQAPGIKEPAQLLLGIKHPVAINSQGQLPWGLGTPGRGLGHWRQPRSFP